MANSGVKGVLAHGPVNIGHKEEGNWINSMLPCLPIHTADTDFQVTSWQRHCLCAHCAEGDIRFGGHLEKGWKFFSIEDYMP